MAFSDFRLLPKFIISKRAVLNPENLDNRSFGYAIVFHFHPNLWGHNPFRESPSPSEKFSGHRLDRIKYPVLISDIPELEVHLSIRINVFTFDDPEGYKRHSLYISPKYFNEEVNLLYWDGRFALIRHFTRLFSDVRKYVYEIYYLFLYINAYILF